jgi:hypothetical protein
MSEEGIYEWRLNEVKWVHLLEDLPLDPLQLFYDLPPVTSGFFLLRRFVSS